MFEAVKRGGLRASSWRVGGLIIALWAAGCALVGGPASACAPAASPEIVCTAQGALRGEVSGEGVAFRGIPYAEPPVGPRRWQAPAEPKPWAGVRDATRFGAICLLPHELVMLGYVLIGATFRRHACA